MDAFATLGLPLTPALSEEEVRAAYLEQSKVPNSDVAALNAAYELLLAPEKRLKHLIELSAPDSVKEWRTVPISESLMQPFMALAKLRPEAEALAQRRQNTASALTKALLERQTLELREHLEQVGFTLDASRKELEATLSLDMTWPKLVEAQAQFAYVSKWQAQVRELLLRLM